MRHNLIVISLIIAATLVGCRQPAPLTSEDIRLNVSVEPDPPAVGEAALIVDVTDPDGNPLDVASISVRGDMDHAGMVPVIESLEDGTGGSYELPFEWTMGGDWIVEVTVELPDGAATTETFEYTLAGEPMEMDDMDMEADATDEAMGDDMGDMDMATEDLATEDLATEDLAMDRPDMQMGGTSAVYMTLTNAGEGDVVMIGGEADVAATVELHETIVEDGVARMVQQGDGIFIPAGETVALEPGGLHVMLIDLQSDLAEGDTTAVTLTFDTGETITLEAPISSEAPAESAPVTVGDLTIDGVWARPSAGSMGMDDMDIEAEATDEALGDDMDDMGMDVTGDAIGDMTAMGGTSAIYMTVTNTGEFGAAMFQGVTDVAAEVQFHETVIEDGIARMEEQPEGILVPAGETITLEPGGLHVMLVDLQADLVEGETFFITLRFDNGEEVTLEPIIASEAPATGDTIETEELVIENVWARPAASGLDADLPAEATEASD